MSAVGATTPANAASDASCEVEMLRLLRRFRPFLQLPLVAEDLKLFCTLVNVSLALRVLETVPLSLHHNSSLALVTLLSLRRCGP